MQITYTLNELSAVAAKIIERSANRTLLFIGEMGAGKTTLIKEIVKQLGSVDRVSSPTFSLVNEYTSPSGPIFHFDFHRIEHEEEVYDMGIEEYFFFTAWKLIEWPQKIENFLPQKYTKISITLLPNGARRLIVTQTNP